MADKKKHDNDPNSPNSGSHKSRPRTSSNGGMNASTGSTQDRQPSMGGSQGTRDEALEEGGYGDDSGYRDSSPSSRDRGSRDENARRASGNPSARPSGDRNSSSSHDSGNDASRRGLGGSGSDSGRS